MAFKLLARGLVAALLAATIASGATAQTYPAKPIKVVVPFPPAGGTDIIARIVTDKLNQTLGWSMVVENKPGAGGNLGVELTTKAPADGYTLVLGQTSNLAINPTLYAKLPYDPLKDLVPVVAVASAPLVLVVPANSPYKTLADVVAAAKAKPGEVNFASPGNGTVAHLTGELLQKTAGVKFQHVPYKGTNQAVNDVMGGQVQLYMSSVPSALSFIRSGKLRALVVTSAQRVNDLPNVPTINESGYKGFDATTWFGLLAPAGTPQPVVTKVNSEVNRILQLPEVRQKIDTEGAVAMGGSPDEFAALVKQEIGRWASIVKESGAKVD